MVFEPACGDFLDHFVERPRLLDDYAIPHKIQQLNLVILARLTDPAPYAFGIFFGPRGPWAAGKHVLFLRQFIGPLGRRYPGPDVGSGQPRTHHWDCTVPGFKGFFTALGLQAHEIFRVSDFYY